MLILTPATSCSRKSRAIRMPLPRGFHRLLPFCKSGLCVVLQKKELVQMQVSGTVEKDGAAVKGLSFKGKWDVELVADLPDGSSRRLWEKNPPAADPSRSECLHPAVQACRALLK